MELQDLIAYAAAALGLLAFLPQTVKTWKTKGTKGISLVMYIVFWIGVALWLAYGIFLKKPPIIIVNAAILTFASLILSLKIRYK